MSGEVEPMDEDRPNGVGPRLKKMALVATPVKAGSSGVGLPYAPEDWPLPGDKWGWKVSKRITVNGYFHDRFLIPPPRFPKSTAPWAKGICSRVQAEQFVTKEIPGATLEEFWGSFIWKIPASNAAAEKGEFFGEMVVSGSGDADLPVFLKWVYRDLKVFELLKMLLF